MGDGTASQPKAPPAAASEAPASLPTASQASKGHSDSKAEAPQASLTAMLGNCQKHHMVFSTLSMETKMKVAVHFEAVAWPVSSATFLLLYC